MLLNARVTAFTLSELLRENQQGVKLPSALTPRLGLKNNPKQCHIFPTQIIFDKHWKADFHCDTENMQLYQIFFVNKYLSQKLMRASNRV